MKPLRIYLDTSDYAKLYRGESSTILSYLNKKIYDKKLVVCFSCVIVFEFIQKFTLGYENDRRIRAKFIKNLCKNNCFKYMGDLKSMNNVYSNEGLWFPKCAQKILSTENLTDKLIEMIFRIIGKKFSKKELGFYMSLGDRQCDEIKDFFPKELFEDDLYIKYLLGKLSYRVIDNILLKTVSDIELFFQNAFIMSNVGEIFFLQLQKLSHDIHIMINDIYNVCDKSNIENIDTIARKNKKLQKMITPYYAEILIAFLKYNLRSGINMKLQKSDAGDTLHAAYIPYSHLWRGDKHISHILTNEKVRYYERIVPTLSELPDRIDKMLGGNEKIQDICVH